MGENMDFPIPDGAEESRVAGSDQDLILSLTWSIATQQ